MTLAHPVYLNIFTRKLEWCIWQVHSYSFSIIPLCTFDEYLFLLIDCKTLFFLAHKTQTVIIIPIINNFEIADEITIHQNAENPHHISQLNCIHKTSLFFLSKLTIHSTKILYLLSIIVSKLMAN